MIIEEKAKLLSAESNPYTIDGKEGVSHKLRFLIGGEIFSSKGTAEDVKEHLDNVGADGTVTLQFTSRRELLGCKFVDFATES